MLAWLSHAISWTWGGQTHPGSNAGYAIFSGPLPDLAFLGAFVALWRRHNCHVPGCLRLSWHPHPDHGHPVCRRHFPDEHKPQGETP